MGNDLPQQGGITGRMPYPANPIPRDISMGMGDGGMSVPGDINAMPPPTFGMPGIEAPDMARNDPWNVNFGPMNISPMQGIQTPNMNMPTPGQGMPEMDAGARMRELYQPQNDASQRFDEMIKQYPQEDNPSWLRRIGAMIVDYTKGSNRAEQFYHEPYNKKVTEWKDKIGPAQQAANLERYENVNQRTMAYQQMQTELREKVQIAKEKNDEVKAKILQQRTDIYAFKALHPDWKIVMTKGGNVMMINPQTQEVHDTGIPTGSMSEMDKITLGQEQALERIAATGEEARTTEGVRQAGRETLVGMRGKEARATKGVASGSASKDLTPSAVKTDRYNKAMAIRNSNPELAKYIKLGSAGDFTVVPSVKPSWYGIGARGPTPEQHKQIIAAIYGKDAPQYMQGSQPTTPAITSPTSGTIKVKNKQGQKGTFKGTPAEAVAAGYEVVK
jgi:hypothetical protein